MALFVVSGGAKYFLFPWGLAKIFEKHCVTCIEWNIEGARQCCHMLYEINYFDADLQSKHVAGSIVLEG